MLCALSASLGGITFGYDQGVIANVLVMKDFRERFLLSSFQIGLLSMPTTKMRTGLPTDTCAAAALELGALFGAIEAGVLANKLSRRKSILVASGQCWTESGVLPTQFTFLVVFCIGSLLQTIASDVNILTAGRCIGGIGVGALRWRIDSLLLNPRLTQVQQYVMSIIYIRDGLSGDAGLSHLSRAIFHRIWRGIGVLGWFRDPLRGRACVLENTTRIAGYPGLVSRIWHLLVATKPTPPHYAQQERSSPANSSSSPGSR